jgi:hypothetical protein
MVAPFGWYHPLLVLYALALMSLAFLALLISSFYRRKFHQPSPRLGFVLTIVLGLLFIASYAFVREGWYAAARAAQAYLLLGCGIASMYGALGLYFTMKKIHK